MTRKLLTLREVAALFVVSPKTVTRWVYEGRLPGIQTPGGHWRVYEDVAQKWLDGQIESEDD